LSVYSEFHLTSFCFANELVHGENMFGICFWKIDGSLSVSVIV